jgi:phosphoinositide-3-kinase regulatory subunit 4
MTDLIENQILSMSNHLIKLHRYKRAENQGFQKDGKIVLDKRNASIFNEIVMVDRKQERKRKDTEPMENWFGAGDQATPSPQTPSGTLNVIQPTPSSSLVEYSMPEKNFFQEKVSDCRLELDVLTSNLKMKYSGNSEKEFSEGPVRSSVPNGWKLNGTLVAHLHEHTMAVTRMTSLKPGGALFASVSMDHTVRVWDCNRLDGRQTINRSKQNYTANSPLTAIAACDNGNSIAVAGSDGSLMILKTDPNSTKMALQQARHLDSKVMLDRTEKIWDDGPVVDMQSMSSGSVIVYATLYGSIVGWDIRSNKNAFKLESDLRNGVITSFCIDPRDSWLAGGTSSGRHLCWDLRFGLKIADIKHPHETRIRRIACNPVEPSCLLSASQGNNDVTSWNIETNSRQIVMWASSAPPFSNNVASNSHSVCALLPGVVDGRGFVVTGGTDQRIRFWDLQDSSNCSLVVPAPKDSQSITTYDSRLIDGTYVIQEIHNSNPNQMVGSSGSNSSVRMEEAPRSGPEMPTVSHHDVITDLVLCRTQKQTFVASSSRDGVIKLWK